MTNLCRVTSPMKGQLIAGKLALITGVHPTRHGSRRMHIFPKSLFSTAAHSFMMRESYPKFRALCAIYSFPPMSIFSRLCAS